MERIDHPDEKFYGRLKSRALTKKQSELFEFLFQRVSITAFREIDIAYRDVFLEIGFGSGEHLAQLASLNSSKLFVGCEMFINGIASLLTKIEQLNLANLKIFQGDARKLLHEIPDKCIDGVFLLFPDPWPKRKHMKRRFIQSDTIVTLHRILKVGGSCRIATDDEGYAGWVEKCFTPFEKHFSIEVMDSESRPPESVWPKTRYEQKAVKSCKFFLFIKEGPL
ncbi:MAG: tRNA (guanosine(46)-N7)-methyltransferase TrmB [Holosporales bacterium]|jgi:tRNA (guanine-N7-)-methyltransferase|nr:tRNA (guanosine(46)-N7)-methyltransferase TrmB [Holosporales bacterium]